MSPSTELSSEHTATLIVGGGPVGLGLAIELGQRGVPCVVIERQAAMHNVPKGQNLTQRTMEHVHRWGVEKALRAARTIPPAYGIGGLTAYGALLGPYSYDWLQRELVRDYYLTGNERLPQYATETVLRRRVQELAPVTALFGWTVEQVGREGDGAVAEVSDPQGRRRRLRARWLVGCDGSRSMVREAAGVTQTLSDHDKLMVLLVFRSKALHGLLQQRYPGKSYFSVLNPALGGYWQFFGRVDLDGTWFFHAPAPPGARPGADVDLAPYLQQAVGAPFDVAFEHVGYWDLRVAAADRYRSGPIFVAGDAAHSHPPYGGYGINTGLEDAANLGWKLAAVHQGWAGPGLLDSYEQERRPVFVSTARDFIEKAIDEDRRFLEAFSPERDRAAFERQWSARGSGARSEVNAFEPHYEGSPIVWDGAGPPSAVGAHAFAARPGHHLAPQPLDDGRNVFDALGPGFTLLALDADPARVQAFRKAAAGLGIPLEVVEAPRAGGRERYDAGLILVRPDQFVAWTDGQGPDDAERVLARAAGTL
ncbi:MAG TPA: FAD-dependent monooxygenase [Caulobacteraceae bacterium]|jgi:2-polyprenyl-6-methoxyphenol hydroxylase-like FAD-dependent oxidoreductase